MIINPALNSELKTALSLKQIYLAPFYMQIFKDNIIVIVSIMLIFMEGLNSSLICLFRK